MPAGKTYVKIASQTLGSASSSLTFSNLPQDYTDLVLIINSQRSANSGNPIRFRFNSDSGSNYSQTNLYGGGSSAQSDRLTSVTYHEIWGLPTSTGISNQVLNIQNYSNRIMNKSTLLRGNNASQQVIQSIGLWRNTSPITAIEIFLAADNISSGSTFTLYGIECAKSPYAEGGDKVYSTGTHWVHEFYNSGTFVPRQNLTADYLVVAGGGGGGSNAGGGGGAGGLRSTVTATGGGGSLESSLSLNGSTAYTVTIGAGGTRGSTDGSSTATNGSNSVFSTITSTGGGRGSNPNANGSNGGSGGGAAGAASLTGGTGTANQGYAGGASNNQFKAGGGGGAGAAGGASTSTTSGNGGAGVATSITGSSITYAGGGGGGLESTGTAGTGGAGGGGNGSGSNQNGVAGTTNTGGGGGGGSNGGQVYGGNGGSGIVIVRYAI